MPGVVMDNAHIGGSKQAPGVHDPRNGASPSLGAGQPNSSADLRNGTIHANGAVRGIDGFGQDNDVSLAKAVSKGNKEPPELARITQGFFPFSTLVNRSVQQCWNDLSDLITELAEVKISPQDSASSQMPANGKTPGSQSPENLQKKLRILEFAHGKRAEFIKLLVLSQWGRQADDVSRLIDLQNFIRTRHQAYTSALQWVGDMKRDLVQAQVANPDLKTALEVLSRGKVVSLSDLGYKPPKPLTPKGTLKRLHKINRIISARLALHESIPRPFQTYRVHDGRVTFIVPGEFELDLSVGEETESSQFFFVDIRFLFSPSSSIPKGRIFNELDIKVNDKLRDSGLVGCFDLLHSLVLTNKINILFKQAVELARGLWSDVLRIELLHRTLVVQYWTLKSGPKSWLEIGIQSGRRNKTQGHGVPLLGLRWMRDGQEVDSEDIEFDTEKLSMESVLRSVIALHISHILSSAYNILRESLLFSTGVLSLRALLTATEPGDCQLDVQLTASRHLRVSIEPMSGASILSVTPSILERAEGDRGTDRTSVDDIVTRVSRLRCIAAIEEVESKVRVLGFETVNPRGLKIDVRRIFPPNVLRFSFFWHPLWERNWIVAATSSMECDNWWVVQLRPTMSAKSYSALDSGTNNQSTLRSAQVISSTFLPAPQQTGSASFPDLGHCLSGMLAIHANARFLADLHCVNFYPSLQKLKIESGLRVPDIFIRYESSNLPQAFRIGLPTGSKKKVFVRDTIRLAFHGVDPRKKVAIIVAYGNLSISVKALGTLISKWDNSLVFQKRGSGFAIRLLAPAGQPVIVNLIENLQRLECVLSIFESLQRKKMTPQSLSLSRIAFAYGPGKDLSATIDIGMSGPSSLTGVDPVDIATKTDLVFHLRLGIRFDHPNPHRRIQESLATILNHASCDVGLDAVVEILSLTLPLMRALDQIAANVSRKEPLKMQVTVRNAKTFQIHYPNQGFRFQLIAGQHSSRLAWILRDVSVPQAKPGQDQLRTRLQQILYNSKGEGWRGLGNGVVADVDKVGNLMSYLDKCLTDAQGDLPFDSEIKPDSLGSLGQPVTTGQYGPGGTTMPNNNRNLQHNAGNSKGADIIMID